MKKRWRPAQQDKPQAHRRDLEKLLLPSVDVPATPCFSLAQPPPLPASNPPSCRPFFLFYLLFPPARKRPPLSASSSSPRPLSRPHQVPPRRSVRFCSSLETGYMAKSSPFKNENDLEKRRTESARIREKYPDRIPVIVEKAEGSDIPSIDKKKYLVPADLTVGQFVYVIRKRIKLSAEKAIFIFIDNVLPPTGAVMSTIYDEKKDDDGFLYVTYSGENTFGLRSAE